MKNRLYIIKIPDNIMNMIKFSVIVCTFNGAKKIKNCLDALKNQKYPSEYIEMIIVDDGSIDNISEIISKYPSFKYIKHEKNFGLGKSRNTGLANASGNIIVFTDDDCIPDKKWIQELANKYKNQEIDGIGGKIESYNFENIIEKYITYSKSPIYSHVVRSTNRNRIFDYIINIFKYKRRELEEGQQLFSLMGANSSYRKSMLDKIGGCDNSLRRGVDWDLNIRLQKKFSPKFVYCDKAIVYHKHRTNLKSFTRHMYQYGKAQSIVAKKFNFFNFPYIFPSLLFLFSLTFLISLSLNFFLNLFFLNIIRNLSLLAIMVVSILFMIKELPYSINLGLKIKSKKIMFLFPLLSFIRESSHSFGTFIGYFKKYSKK
jgi:glycosyltransferase involved in cell wall biosynthesis